MRSSFTRYAPALGVDVRVPVAKGCLRRLDDVFGFPNKYGGRACRGAEKMVKKEMFMMLFYHCPHTHTHTQTHTHTHTHTHTPSKT